jgi:hypothetical protein
VYISATVQSGPFDMPSHFILLELNANMGVTLLKIQNAESVLKIWLQWLGSGNPDATLEALEAREQTLRKHTLGRLLKDFKQVMPFQDDFAAGMELFLERRNTFVHEFLKLPGFNLTTEEGVAFGIDFLRELANQADLLVKVITGLNEIFLNPHAPVDPLDSKRFNEVLALMMLKPST